MREVEKNKKLQNNKKGLLEVYALYIAQKLVHGVHSKEKSYIEAQHLGYQHE